MAGIIQGTFLMSSRTPTSVSWAETTTTVLSQQRQYQLIRRQCRHASAVKPTTRHLRVHFLTSTLVEFPGWRPTSGPLAAAADIPTAAICRHKGARLERAICRLTLKVRGWFLQTFTTTSEPTATTSAYKPSTTPLLKHVYISFISTSTTCTSHPSRTHPPTFLFSSSTYDVASVSIFRMASLKKIFDPRQNGAAPRNLPPPFELPNERIDVEIKLMKRINSVLKSLKKDLQQHNMDDVTLHPPENSITISGIPPVNGFDKHTVLAIVQRHDPNASLLVPPRS